MTSPLTIIEQPTVLRAAMPRPRPRSRGGTAVWDVDGTLVLGDTLLPFLRRFTGTARLGGILLDSVVRSTGTSDRRSAAKAAVLRQVLGGREVAAVDQAAREYVAQTVSRRVRADCLRRWQWHREQGHRLVLASASLGLYLDHLGALLGADEVISTGMELADGRLTGRLATPNCRGAQKAGRVRDYLWSHPGGTVWAYANGSSDRPMLALADVAVQVRPYRTLPLPDGSDR